MRRELGTLFSDNVTTSSVDEMAKIKVGAPAVSRYHLKVPNFDDHDFPVPGYLLSVSGHMFSTLMKTQVTVNSTKVTMPLGL